MTSADPRAANALGVHQSILNQPWLFRTCSSGLAAAIAQQNDVPEMLGRVLAGRGVSLEEAGRVLTPTLRDWLPDPSIFIDMDQAALRLSRALQDNQAIVVFGDYDVDGATSSALLLRVLRALGAQKASAYIPDRISEGYGPSGASLTKLKHAGADLVVCVDCGTQAFDAFEAAAQCGLDVVVVDHHKASTELPKALALVNPNRFDESAEAAEYGYLAAVGLTFLLCVALVRCLRLQGYFNPQRPEPSLLQELDLVALGTVCDVVPLKGLNRAMVAQGLKVMAKRGNLGLRVLGDSAGIDSAPTTTTCGFHLGPRINAGGRVGRSDLGVRLLTTTHTEEAQALSTELNLLNAERRALEAQALEEALGQAEATSDPVVFAVGACWHPGIIGIIASRLKERTRRPSFVLTLYETTENNAQEVAHKPHVAKGSGRSIAGVDMGAGVLAASAAGLLVAGGGHAMAAGLSVVPEKIPELKAFLNDYLARAVGQAQEKAGLLLDGSLAPAALTPSLVQAIEAAGPYGAGFANPRFALGPVRIVRSERVGQDHVRIIAQGIDGQRLKAVAFRVADQPLGAELLAPRDRHFWLAGRLVLDTWGSRPQAELHIEDAAFAN